MEKLILFKNTGEIELNCFKLLGASTKREDSSKIGFFGSGLKYALAYLIRNNIEFHCYQGDRKIEITTQQVNLRDQEFLQVLIDGEPTSITTSWGINWGAWQIFRELACNAMDEGGSISETTTIAPQAGETQIYIRKEPFAKYFDNMSEYIRPELLNAEDQAFEKARRSDLVLFKKGVRVSREDTCGEYPSIYDYQLGFELNEERETINHDWPVVRFLKRQAPVSVCKKLLESFGSNKGRQDRSFEMGVLDRFGGICGAYYSNWLDAVKELGIVLASDHDIDTALRILTANQIAADNIRFLPNDIYQALYESFKDEKVFIDNYLENTKYALYELPDADMDRVMGLVGIFRQKFPTFTQKVEVVDFYKKGVIGFADRENNRVLLSKTVITESDNFILSTLVEEYIHLFYKVDDCTRGFQSAACDIIAKTILGEIETAQDVIYN